MSRILLCVGLALILLAGCNNEGTKPNGNDTTPPGKVTSLAVTSPPGRLVTLTWTAPGDDGTDGQASAYRIRYTTVPVTEQNWDSAAAVSSPPTPKPAGQAERFDVDGLADGTWYFALKAGDDAGNWSSLSNVVSAEVADAVAPEQVTDLRVAGSGENNVTLAWTAPGNDGAVGRAATYDLRYANVYVTDENWVSATRVQNLGAPSAAGATDSVTIDGLSTGQDYYFALKTADQRPNWSTLSNVISVTPIDAVPPAQVTDLALPVVTANSITLTWTAPGDDGTVGRATAYDLRYATTSITHETFPSATRVEGVPAPDTSGTSESFTVTGLTSGQIYYLALKTADSVPNWSALSNVVSAVPDSTSLRRLTENPLPGYANGASVPTWSPDGARIAFHADWTSNQGRSDIYTILAAGGSTDRLTNDPTTSNVFPSWSPDGEKIAYSSGPPLGEGSSTLWVMNAADGSGAIQLTHTEGHVKTSTWSPDGARIAYVVVTSTSTPLYVIPSTGGAPVLLTDQTSRAWSPAWSPDGSRIAFSWNQGGTSEIWVISPDGTEAVQLTHTNGGFPQYPTWSPDGRRIAFSSRQSGNLEIYVMPAEGGELTQLTFDPATDLCPAWSPDGSRIAFSSTRTGSNEIWVMQVDR